MKKYMRVILSIVLLAYVVAAGIITSRLGAERRLAGVRVEINDTAQRGFVTRSEIMHELSRLSIAAPGQRLDRVNTDSMERFLAGNDKIESVNVVRLSNDSILVRVDPMVPVARVFEPGLPSYYINRNGKHMKATARYHINVPVITGSFTDTAFTAASLIPLVDYISSHPVWDHFVTMIKVDSPRDVILVPAIRGHVVNIGGVNALDSKFDRLTAMYRKVLPVKGWQYYDTLSVKWGGQVVATRAAKAVKKDETAVDDDEDVDVTTMLVADNVATGQAVPGMKAHVDKEIPAARKAKADTARAKQKPAAKPAADKAAPKKQTEKKKQ